MLFSRATLSRTLPFVVYILLLALNDSLATWMLPLGHDARWLYGVRILVVASFLAWFWRDYSELSANDLPTQSRLSTSGYLLSIAVGLLVFVLWIAPYPAWAIMGEAQHGVGFNPLNADGKTIDTLLAITRITGAALIVPLMEELFWRSFFMRWLQDQDFLKVNPAYIGHFAFFASAALFAVEHSLWLAGLIAGFAYGWLYKSQRNLWSPIIAHAVTNGLLGLWVLYTAHWDYW